MTTHALNLTSPGELLAAIPFLLGFHPRQSVVLTALQQRRLSLTQRLDLPDPDCELEAAKAMIRPLLRDQADSALVIGYEDEPGQGRPIIDRLSGLLADNRIRVIDRIVVYDGRWRSLDCADPDCCPPQGTQVPEPADVPPLEARSRRNPHASTFRPCSAGSPASLRAAIAGCDRSRLCARWTGLPSGFDTVSLGRSPRRSA